MFNPCKAGIRFCKFLFDVDPIKSNTGKLEITFKLTWVPNCLTGLGITNIFEGSHFTYDKISCFVFSETVVMNLQRFTGKSNKNQCNRTFFQPLYVLRNIKS